MSTTGYITQNMITIQGEGPNIGTPSLLIRLGGCNLQCPFCDSQWTNDMDNIKQLNSFIKHKSVPCKLSQLSDMPEYFKYLNKKFFDHYPIKNIMITGGEPFLNFKFLDSLIHYLSFNKQVETIEIETNGSLLKPEYIAVLESRRNIHLNISPKMDLSCYKNENVLSTFNSLIKKYKLINSYLENTSQLSYVYKIIHHKDQEENIKQFIINVEIPSNKIFLMPLTPKAENTLSFYNEFRINSINTMKFCVNHNYRMSDRLHVWAFDPTSKTELNV